MVKRILGWVIFALVALFIGFVVWLFFFREESANTTYTPPERGDSFFPVDINNTSGNNALNPDGTPITPGTPGSTIIPRVRQLSQVPVAGSVAFERPTGSSETFISDTGVEERRSFTITNFRYIERATGHLYEARENSLTQTRLSNTTLPKINDAKFTPDGEYALLQYVGSDDETVETLVAKVTPKSTTSPDTFQIVADGYALEGVYLPQNLVSADILQKGISYVLPNTNGGVSVILADLRDQTKRVLHQSSFAEWVIQRVNDGVVTLTTKADSRVGGFMYELNTSGGLPVKILEDIVGLTTLTSPKKTWVIYSTGRESELETYAYNTTTKQSKRLGVKTLPEKCAFSQQKEDVLFCGATDQPERVPYPETWYQGVTSFNDNLWQINLTEETYDALLINKEEVPESFDMTKLAISPRDEFVLFVNKKDLTLWSIDITKARGVR
jgi:hypothetical protein